MEEKRNIFEKIWIWIAPSIPFAIFMTLKDNIYFEAVFWGIVAALAIYFIIDYFRRGKEKNIKQGENNE